jgi:5-methyltetrahydrofolate--homocysteine methyltransferase
MASRLQLLRETLARRPLLGDGATGTQLQLQGLAPGACGELWCVDQPERVRQVHRAYLAASADLLTTNSFGGTSFVLAGHGAGARVREINAAAARLAREVAGDRAWVLGDVGPFGGMLEPLGEAQPDDVIMAFCEQTAALLEGGADAILIETMSDPVEAALAVAAAKSVRAEFIIATYSFQQSASGYRTMMGNTIAECVAAAIDAGADVVGANCGTELSLVAYEQLTAELVAAAGTTPVIVQPNAGSPKLIGGKIHYATTPAAFAAAASRFAAAGARVVGGCCGSTPAHIAAMAALLKR